MSMNRVISRLSGPLRRAWRVRGFGVHSPFAYSYLRTVIRPGRGARYYAEDELASRRDRLLYRIGVEAGEGRMVTLADTEMVPVANDDVRTYVALTPRSARALQRWASEQDCGVLFRSPRMAVFCLRRGIPSQSIEVAMP